MHEHRRFERQIGAHVDRMQTFVNERLFLVEQTHLTEKDARVFWVQSLLEKVDARPGQMRQNVFFGCVERCDGVITIQTNVIAVDVPEFFGQKNRLVKWF